MPPRQPVQLLLSLLSPKPNYQRCLGILTRVYIEREAIYGLFGFYHFLIQLRQAVWYFSALPTFISSPLSVYRGGPPI